MEFIDILKLNLGLHCVVNDIVYCRYGGKALVIMSSMLIFASMVATGAEVGIEDTDPWQDLSRRDR